MNIRLSRIIPLFFWAFALVTYGQESDGDSAKVHPESVKHAGASGVKDGKVYQLQVGDLIEMRVIGEPEISIKKKIDTTGNISFYLIGTLEVGGRSISKLEEILEKQYRKGFLVDPKVKVTVLERADREATTSDELVIAKLQFQDVKKRYLAKHPKYLGALAAIQKLQKQE